MNSADPLGPAGRQVERQAADPHAVEGQARAAVLLEEVEDLLALAEGVPEGRHRAEVDARGPEPHEVRGEALQLVEDDADQLGAPRAPRRRSSFSTARQKAWLFVAAAT